MGVTNLWQILEPVRQPVSLSSLKGKTLAVDLSLWVCEAQTVKKMIGVVTKPHLRNLFFRYSFFTSMGIKLVFVMEGEAPKLKADTMSKRNEMRYGASNKHGAARTGRSLFKSILKECLQLLDCLGVPWVQAAGEAEAMCAYLSAKGHVDGCITNDGDVFLYGAQTVYRNFAMNSKEPHLDCYTMSSIKEKLGCDRETLIGLAVLLGCDYLPKGVPGVGKEQALKLIETLGGQNLLQRFEQWKEQSEHDYNPPLVVKRVVHCSDCHHPGSYKEHERSGCKFCESTRYCKPSDSKYCCPCEWHQLEQVKQASAVEDNIRKKANSCEGFPFSEVIQEFLVNKNKLNKIMECKRPNLLSFQIFASEKMEWEKHYACKKLLALLTHYDMIQRKSGYTDSKQLQAIRIVKTRVKNGVPCYEIEWQKPEHYVDAEDEPVELYVVTIEEQPLFQAAYPDVVALYQMEKSEALAKKQKNKKNRPKEKELLDAYGEVTNFLSQMNLKSAHEIIPVPDHTSDGKTPPEYQICQRSTESKDPVIAAASCVTSVQMSESVVLSQTASLGLHLQRALTDSSAVPAQFTKNSEVSSSVTADLQLSSIDGKGTFFSTSPTLEYNTCDPAPDLSAYIKHSYPLHHKTVKNSLQCSGAAQSDRDHSDSADDLFSDGHVEHLQKLSLSERILKTSVPSKSVLPEDVMQQEPFKHFKHTEAALKLDKDYLSSSCQLNKLVQDAKNVLPETCARESSAPVSQESDTLHEMMQKDCIISCSTSLAPRGQTTEPLHTVCEVLPLPLSLPVNVAPVHNVTKTCTQAAWKTSFKSVCQSKCSSSEDSDDGNMNKNPICKQQQRQLNPGQFKKTFTKKRYNTASSKSTGSDSALLIKGMEKTTDFKEVGGNLSLEVSPKNSSVVVVDCFRSSEQQFQGTGSSPAQVDSDVLISLWADSPLPLSERLKRRLKSS
ncbi:flap endonuclease GEN homolog 1 isoform X1 [Phasianus colchicus]|uniref:Flap endonuclease GEN homolog 1 n=2 Tax=Phasianus colchicus TaxID=9054 RepID=A0A669QRY3_PHACC|nr:flap endonuclease GEN homolog 1 isoform X1 [Phasianus colchicus]XP_031467139.1 flap endonuclease GEN homolog 1 isoform X1 [Phasianus colchicus]XP_031467140.1 flap endonuclease GEN homolog 1 isoform X1 [Phasianus colchicus]XP_031467141.1 flap endonuclease GEN homolog 1 isoform X1 [Phasianus colchicus]XP_031467142.1 flap endonuclease GEN homolog 1 isoform X1 [Phasianus colchicus]